MHILQVIMSFLFVGHTHEDVDAGFSKIAEKLRKTDAETVEELKKLLPDVQELEGMLDIKAWLSPHLATLSHHSGHHHFRFAMVDGKPAGFYKMQQHLPWTQMEGSLFNEYPRRRPQVLKPDYTRINLETLKKQIDLMSYLFKDAITIEWWTKYIEKLQRGKSEKSVSFIEKLPRQPITIQETQSSERVVPVEVEKMISKETDTAQVSTYM